MWGKFGGWWVAPLLALIVILGIYVYTPIGNPVPVVEDVEANWTGYSGTYSGSVTGRFVGYVGVRNSTAKTWDNMSGFFRGRCVIENSLLECYMNLTRGGFIGTKVTDYTWRTDTDFTGNISGEARGWKLMDGGYLPKGEAAPKAKGFDFTILFYVLLLVGFVYVVWEYRGRQPKRRKLSDSVVGDKLRDELREHWSTDLLEVVKTNDYQIGDINEVRVHFRLTDPFSQDAVVAYDLPSGSFNKFNFRAKHSDVERFLNAEVEFVRDVGLLGDARKRKQGKKV